MGETGRGVPWPADQEDGRPECPFETARCKCGQMVRPFWRPPVVGLEGKWWAPDTTCRACREKERERRDRLDWEDAKRARQERALAIAGLPRVPDGVLLADVVTNEFNLPAVNAAKRMTLGIADVGGEGLMFHGDTGRGKTWVAEAMARTMERSGSVVLFISVPDLLARVRQAIGRRKAGSRPDDIVDAAREVDVLILDDLGAESAGTWAQEILFRLVDYRLKGRHLVVTTNVDEEVLRERLGGRVTSRLIGYCAVAEMGGPDRRRA